MARQLLLIEDEANIAEAIGFILSRDGWHVAHVSDGAAALDAARRVKPDLVILDHMLPGMPGIDVLIALRADPEFATLPVLMLTARGHPRDREAAVRAGASAFMTKPFANADIRAVVRQLTGGDGP